MRVAALDLGSNTSLLLVADMEGRKISKVVHDETTITRLGQGVHAQRKFHPEALQRMDDCLKAYRATINNLGAEKVVAVATSAARDVSNGDALLALGRKHGIPIHIISGKREAELSFLGALCDRTTSTAGMAVIDVGGGSTEIITGIGGHSVDVGSVRLTEMFVRSDPMTPDTLRIVQEFAEQAFAKAPLPQGMFSEVIAVAGTPTTLAALDQRREFKEEWIHGYKLPLVTIDQWIVRLSKMSTAERQELPGMQPKRADVIVQGAVILAAAVRALKKNQVTVSTRGVRYGAAIAWEEFQ